MKVDSKKRGVRCKEYGGCEEGTESSQLAGISPPLLSELLGNKEPSARRMQGFEEM